MKISKIFTNLLIVALVDTSLFVASSMHLNDIPKEFQLSGTQALYKPLRNTW